MKYIANAFSLNMLNNAVHEGLLVIKKREISKVPNNATSIVGHQTTADVFSTVLGFPVDCNRTSFTLEEGDHLFIGQYTGPRLEEGTTKLPEGAVITWYEVWLEECCTKEELV